MQKGYVGLTDPDWYRYLAGRPQLDEVANDRLRSARCACRRGGDAPIPGHRLVHDFPIRD